MSTDPFEREFYVCVPNDPDAPIWQSLSREDWKRDFDVLELDRNQVSILASLGLWDKINETCVAFMSMFIDIFEQSVISIEGHDLLLDCIRLVREETPSDEPGVIALLEGLHQLVAHAKERRAPIVVLF